MPLVINALKLHDFWMGTLTCALDIYIIPRAEVRVRA